MIKSPEQKGFTFIELLIVIAILALLAYIAIPNMLKTHMSVNEKAIKLSLRAFHAADEAFRKDQKPPAYAETIAQMVNPGTGHSYLDSSWDLQPKQGFSLAYIGGGRNHPDAYSLVATPAILNQTAKHSFCIDQRGLLVISAEGDAPPQGTEDGCIGGNAIIG